MNYIKTIKRVKDHKIVIDVPEEFENEDVEVIVLPVGEETSIDKSIMSLSEESFKEWDNDADDRYNDL